jgi:hypothetical protein
MHRLRRLRGLLGLSIATALAWIPLSAVIAAVDSLRGVQVLGRPFSVSGIFANAPVFAAVGAFCGFVFGLALAGVERKRTFEALTFGRFVALGVASAMVIPVAAMLLNFGGLSARGMVYSLAIFGIPGGLSAAALLAIARRAPQPLASADAPIALEGS